MWPDVLLHLLPVAHSAAADPYLVLGLVFLGVLLAAIAGFLGAHQVLRRGTIAALAVGFSAGALLFLFFDLVKEAASLGQGLVAAPLLQLGLVAAFALGALALAWLGRGAAPLRLAWLWTLGIMAHGAGEGWIIGTEAASAEVAPLGMLSFLLHKGIEAFTVPVVAGLVLRTGQAAAMGVAIAAATLVAGLAGFLVGSGPAPLFLFAAGAGAAAFALLRLGSLARPTPLQTTAMVLGVVAVYGAGLLHELPGG